MPLKSLSLGFLTKVITGFDDTLTHVPIISSLTRTFIGKIAFILGILLGISLAVIFSVFFSTILEQFKYHRYIIATLLIVLAITIYFDLFVHNPRKKAEKKIKKTISVKRFSKLLGIGFLASFVTVLDDAIAYSSILLTNIKTFAVIGIFLATFLELAVILYFSKKISKIKYKEEITSIGLVILAILIVFNII